ncbi:MAG: hypothetical protein FWB96_08800 [Defluviitaleaceae bacterium]|nr:hypothetical protein [Defluviitaleaceae bacterium]MCL2264119.1 hypothetical protein [Defluviitaleaceae bacterium]
MPTLNWIGKNKVVNHHQDVTYRVLDFQYAHGDNLDALKALFPKYEGHIKCVYIDPPYNTGNENWVYNDNVNYPDGAIFISIDDNEQVNLRLICDEIFDASNFVTQIVSQRTFATKNDAKYFSSEHEYCTVYAKHIDREVPSRIIVMRTPIMTGEVHGFQRICSAWNTELTVFIILHLQVD